MLLVQMTINGTVRYLSNQVVDIEHFYEPHIASMGSIRVETRQVYGGYAEPTFGSIVLVPTVFTADWPPPVSCAMKVMITATNEAAAQTLFEGNAHLKDLGRDEVVYDLYGKSYDTLADVNYVQSFWSVFSSYCTDLGLTLNSTYARTPSPWCQYNDVIGQPVIDIMSDLAAFFSHRFYIIGTTVYLVDCLLDNGPVMDLTEYDIFPSKYVNPQPYKLFTADYIPLPTVYEIRIYKTTEPDYAALTNIEFHAEAGDTADLTSTIGGTAAGLYYSTYVPANAVDASSSTHWLSTWTVNSSGQYFTYWNFTLNTGARVKEYKLMCNTTITRAPIKWTIAASDGIQSKKLAEVLIERDWVLNTHKTFSLPDYLWKARVAGAYAYGKELSISPTGDLAGAGVLAALANIKTIMERKRIEIVLPLDTVPKIGQKITLTDESLLVPITVWARVSAIVYDFDNDQCVIEGEGEIS